MANTGGHRALKRALKRIKQTDLALRSGLAQSRISGIKAGGSPSAFCREALRAALGIPFSAWLTPAQKKSIARIRPFHVRDLTSPGAARKGGQ